MPHPKVTIYPVGDDWSAAYADGQLLKCGDVYNVYDAVFDLLGVETRESAYMSEKVQRRDQAPKTETELSALDLALEERKKNADTLRETAAKLLAEAQPYLAAAQ